MVLRNWLEKCPLVAILRGISLVEIEPVFSELIRTGICIAEIPLSSSHSLDCIRVSAQQFGSRILLGAGTVTYPSQVSEVYAAAGRLIVTPHADAAIVAEAKRLGMIAIPGIATPTEAFSMLQAGADGLKLFPANLLGPSFVTALQTVLPSGTLLIPVGGVEANSIPQWRNVKVDGYGIGSSLYVPGMSATEIGKVARACVTALRVS